jgi:vacuolar iron transporter family protein
MMMKMKFELGLERPNPKRSYISAITISVSYFVSALCLELIVELGGLIPLIPYIAIQNAYNALYVSASVTLVALFIFGYSSLSSTLTFSYVKAVLLGSGKRLYSAVQTTIIGALAGGAAYGIAKLIPQTG